jgi:hypothetical protein
MMSGYVLVFDVRNVPPFDWTTVAICASLAAVCLFLTVQGRFRTEPERSDRSQMLKLVGMVGGIVISIVCAGELLLNKAQNDSLKKALDEGAYTRVEGVVEGFIPGDRAGHLDESWRVRSGGEVYTYSYRSSVRVPGFHRSAGPIRGGLQVRIADVNGYIARLEIAERR